MVKQIMRVFPRKTSATPDDELVRINCGPGLLGTGVDEIHISVSFSWDLPRAEALAKMWRSVAPVKIGGPATGQRSEEFVPGMYVRKGKVVTSRGCPNKCWFCSVWKREGGIRELPIHDGFDVLDDNILACSDKHIDAVFSMLRRQKEPVKFTGGLEAAILKEWHVRELGKIKLHSAYFAYDTPNDLEPLQKAGRMLVEGGLLKANGDVFRCFVLAGYPKDTFGDAETRVRQTTAAGFVPFVMLYRGEDGEVRSNSWKDFRSRWGPGANRIVTRSICWMDRAHLFE